MFEGPFGTSMLKKAQDESLVKINIHNLRNWTEDKHKTVDDRPYGGGPGMIMKVDVIDRALEELKSVTKIPKEVRASQSAKSKRDDKAGLESLPALSKVPEVEQVHYGAGKSQMSKVILLSAKGKTYNQVIAHTLSKFEHIILIAGHYEGVDHRVHEHMVDDVISIGDYVLTGGEIPAMVIVDSVVRLIPGVLKPESLENESFSKMENDKLKMENYTEYPQYTRPETYKDWKVPEVLLSGNHKEIERWRKEKSNKKSE